MRETYRCTLRMFGASSLLLGACVGLALVAAEGARLEVASRQPTGDGASPDDPASGWPNLFGPSHNGISRERGIRAEWPETGPPMVWSREVGSGYSSPIARGERLLLLHRVGDEEVLECFHPETGRTQWTFAHSTDYRNKYHYSHGPYSTPLLSDDSVYTVSAKGVLHCVGLRDGGLRWRRALYDEYGLEPGAFAVAASPLLDEDRLIFNLGAAEQRAGVIALDRFTGETLWTATDHRASCATPVAATIDGRRYVFVMTFEGLVALDPASGQVFWTVEHRPKAPDSVNATSPIVMGDRVIAVTGPGPGAVCVRVLPDGTCEEVWRDRGVLDSQFNNLIPVGDHFFGYSARRQGGPTFRCIRGSDGKLRWKWPSPLERGTALAADGHFILWGEHGHLASLEIAFDRPRVRALTAEPLLETPCYSSPALHKGLLYVRNERRMLCLDLREEGSSEADGVRGEGPRVDGPRVEGPRRPLRAVRLPEAASRAAAEGVTRKASSEADLVRREPPTR